MKFRFTRLRQQDAEGEKNGRHRRLQLHCLCCLVPPLALLLGWDWHERGLIGKMAALGPISKYARRASHQPWMHKAKFISPMAFVGLGQQQPPYSVALYLSPVERWLRGAGQPWPAAIVRNVREGDVVVILRPMMDEVLAELEARGAATPPFTLVSVNYDDPVTPQMRERLGAAPALRRVFAQNLMAGAHGDKIHPLPLGFPTHEHTLDGVEQLVEAARALRANLTRSRQLLPRVLVATRLDRHCSVPTARSEVVAPTAPRALAEPRGASRRLGRR